MKIGIDASRAFTGNRTGIEEYSYQVIKHLRGKFKNDSVFLYVREKHKIDFDLPRNWKAKVISFPYLWTQLGLSLELLFHPIDVLFVPAHTVPMIHPRKTFVAIHGLEYEMVPESYSLWERLYMRWSIKLSCRWAKKIIAVSKNTKKDLMRLYKIPEKKIEVIYEGIENSSNSQNTLIWPSATFSCVEKGIFSKPYLLFIGRLEKRKNIEGMVDAFEILKEKYKIPHKLILAGKPGYGYNSFEFKVSDLKSKKDIIETGFVTEEEKISLLKNADIFLFPTFYEGFGLPVLEAQGVGVPVVASNISSIPEVAGVGAAYCDPLEVLSIVDSTYCLIKDKDFKDDIIEKGRENIKRFSWEKCASQIADMLKSKT